MNRELTRNRQQGFTLIELMIVIAILGILIAIALPAYQDYSIRTKNSECLNVAAAAKLAVSETYHSAQQLASIDNAKAGYNFAPSKYCASITIAAGVITAVTQGTGAANPATFVLKPDTAMNTGRIKWTCSNTGGAPASQIPGECRN